MATPRGIPELAIERYTALIATRPGIERKGKGMPYTSINGHMFSFLTPDGTLALRLSIPDRDQFLEQHPDAEVVQHGRVMKEYVSIPHELFARTDALAPLFARSDYVESPRPKSTTP
jgi:hypothetical protein